MFITRRLTAPFGKMSVSESFSFVVVEAGFSNTCVCVPPVARMNALSAFPSSSSLYQNGALDYGACVKIFLTDRNYVFVYCFECNFSKRAFNCVMLSRVAHMLDTS